MTQAIEQPPKNLVDLLASTDQPKRWVERKLAEMAQGVIASLRDAALSIDEAREELFNLDNYSALRRRRMSRDLKELFEWGMELGNVTRLAPESLPESIDSMTRLARRIIEQPVRMGRRRRAVGRGARLSRPSGALRRE